jgi:hypothetical protein
MRLADSQGTIAIPTTEMQRFLLFTISLASTNQPPGCYLNAAASASVTENLNLIMRQLRDEDQWVWIMGDDHCWQNDTLVRMLQTMDEHPEIDVLVPLVTKRNPPWHLVLFEELDQVDESYHSTPLFKPLDWEQVPSEGVFEVDAAGSAGMLLRRHVIDALEDPWFYSTTDLNGRGVVLNEDVTFCTRIRREHGFRIFATADCVLGHLGIFNVRPMHNGERWGALTEFSSMDDKFRHIFMPVEEHAGV